MIEENFHKSIYKQKIWYSHQIKKVAESKNVSCSELSILSGLSEDFMDRLYHAEVVPSKSTLQRIAIALEVPIDTLELPRNY